MRTEPMFISGLAGPVVVTVNPFTGKQSVTVAGYPVPRRGRGHCTLPAAEGGVVAARVRSSFADPYPVIEIGGVKHRTGPSVPVVLRVLAVLPIVLVGIGGLIGGAIGGAGVVGNLAILRTAQSAVVKVVWMILVLAAAVTVWTIVATALV
jgi:hypothetical protein